MTPEKAIAPTVEPEVISVTPAHPLPNKEEFQDLMTIGAVISTPVGQLDMAIFRVDHENLPQAMADTPGYISWFGGFEVAADHVLRKLELNLKRVRAELQITAGRTLESQSIKVTVAAITAFIDRDANVQGLEEQLNDAHYNLSLFQMLRRAMESKRTMISSAVGLKRSQMESELQDRRTGTPLPAGSATA